LAAVKVWTRQKFKGTAALKKKVNPTRVPIEKKESIRWLDNLAQSTELLGDAGRCVHIGDRESDIYELFCLAHELGTHFLLRTCVNRRAGDGDYTVADEMAEVAIEKRHRDAAGLNRARPRHRYCSNVRLFRTGRGQLIWRNPAKRRASSTRFAWSYNAVGD
jgi:hypothetical protein